MKRPSCGKLHGWSSSALLARLRAARQALEDAEQELQKTHRDDR
jgi:hypothetical protein